jgi:hypothetical protein
MSEANGIERSLKRWTDDVEAVNAEGSIRSRSLFASPPYRKYPLHDIGFLLRPA